MEHTKQSKIYKLSLKLESAAEELKIINATNPSSDATETEECLKNIESIINEIRLVIHD